MRHFLSLLAERHRRRRSRDGESGVALLLSISMLALLIALTSEFTYDTSIHSMQAANARDEVRAHHLARASINVSRMLIKVQQRFIDPIMKTASKMMADNSMGDLGISLRITDYAGPIMGFFGGSEAEVKMLAGMVGIDTSAAKGLGLKSGRMDAEIIAEDGKININCGSGATGDKQSQLKLYRLLSALFYSPRYNNLFAEQNASGQFIERADLARAVIDWADGDLQQFSAEGASSSGEDYRYNDSNDPYRAHDNSYDTVGELALVRGFSQNMLEAFSPFLTVYAGDRQCRVNLRSVKGDCTPLLVGLVRAALFKDPTKPPADLSVLDDTRIYPLASILCERGEAVGFDDMETIVSVLSNPQASIARDDPRYALMQTLQGITITKADLDTVAIVDAPRVYRIVATGEAGKVKKKITAIVDMQRTPAHPLTQDVQAEKAAGVLQYWREE